MTTLSQNNKGLNFATSRPDSRANEDLAYTGTLS